MKSASFNMIDLNNILEKKSKIQERKKIKRIALIETISLWSSGILILIGVLFISFESCLNSSLSFDCSAKGLSNFLNIFSGPIKFIGAGFAMFLVWLTSLRMGQTQLQIELIEQNNNFKSYLDFRTLFFDEFRNSQFIKNFQNFHEGNTNLEVNRIINLIFKSFFSTDWRNFRTDPIPNGNEFLKIINEEFEYINDLLHTKNNNLNSFIDDLELNLSYELVEYLNNFVKNNLPYYFKSDTQLFYETKLNWDLFLTEGLCEFLNIRFNEKLGLYLSNKTLEPPPPHFRQNK